MKTTRTTLLALVAVLALLLGAGTAVAGPGLTKGKVKKIAAQVVKKKAGGLSVAAAGNAANLGGQPPSAYLNEVRQFRLPASEASSVKTFRLGSVPAGTYLATYQVVFTSSTAASCWLVTAPASPVRRVLGLPTFDVAAVSVTAGGVVTLDGVFQPVLTCEAQGSGDLLLAASDNLPSTVALTRVGPLTEAAAVAVPSS